MKRILALSVGILSTFFVQGQEQHIGLSTSPRGGIIAADLNPAELSNMRNKYEIGIIGLQVGAFNNSVNLNDLTSQKTDNERFDKVFASNNETDVRINVMVMQPAFAMKISSITGKFCTSIPEKI